MRLSLSLLFLSCLIACVPTAKTPITTSSASINPSAPFVWNKAQFPLTLRISTDFSASERTAIQSAANRWTNSLSGSGITFYNTSATTTNKAYGNLDSYLDGELGVYKLTNWGLGSGVLAVTQIFGRRFNIGTSDEYVRIEHADVLMNYRQYGDDYTKADKTAIIFDADVETVVLHELGHFLGLQHMYTFNPSASVMYPSIDLDDIKRIPQTLDITTLSNLYSLNLFPLVASTQNVTTFNLNLKENEIFETVSSYDETKIILELHRDKTCVHKIDGVEVKRHSINQNH